jgi:translation initiation factor IF-2
MKVHELAKELGLTSKEVLTLLHKLGSDVKSHMSKLEDDVVEIVRHSMQDKVPAAAEASKPEPTEPAKVETAVATPPEAPPAPEPEPEKAPPRAVPAGNVITIRGSIVVKELAEKMNMRPNQLITELMSMNVFASINQRMDFAVAQKLAAEHGITLEHEKRAPEPRPIPKALQEQEDIDRPEDIMPRPAVVTMLGHVDHGKTSLLDRIRNTAVADGEAGGITQHIGAYTVEVNDRSITFLDTPGHAAFTSMRARGANLTDIAIIVIAADDGIMPQTKEAILHARAANAVMMVAINKIDLPGSKPERVRQQLQAEGLATEEWGGEVICCEVSAATGKGLEHLLESILLQAEMLELKANPKRRASGYVIEARLESGMGPTANLLVRSGTLAVGDLILSGEYWGRVKALINDKGVKVRTAGPSTPVKCMGLSGVPEAGAEFRVAGNEKVARATAEALGRRLIQEQQTVRKKVSLDNLYDHLKTTGLLELKIILKTDVQGSLEAIRHSLDGLKSDKISLTIILGGVGNITANDVLLASASDAIVVGFNVSKENTVAQIAKQEGVEIRLHSVIYELIDELRDSMTGMLAPKLTESYLGRALVQEVFEISKVGRIAGCLLADGRTSSRARARVKRANETIYEGSIQTLRRFQNEAAEVKEGQECGIRLDNFETFEKNDMIEFYDVVKTAQSL